jgi:glycosyltransferase involved in cell wall biosynthesis
MRILSVLTYYRPHTSGLTIYAERLARAWVKRGHQVTILTSRFHSDLPPEEMMDGVHVVRAPVVARVSKGVIMPTFGWLSTRLVMQNDVIQLHLPQFDAAGIALRGRLLRKPTVVTYHCDLIMPDGVMAWAANQAVNVMNRFTGIFTHRFVTYTQDYADHSPLLKPYLKKTQIISPPVVLPKASQEAVQSFQDEHNPQQRHPVIAMASRFATEKGVEVLLDALPAVFQVFPDAMVQFAGAYQNIMGEEQYYRRLIHRINAFQQKGQWHFLGNLSPEQMSAFYPNIDVLVMPSLNSTEAFGLVQIEAMMNGKPTIASDLPGVRQPPTRHKMGKVIPIGDSNALSEALIYVLSHPEEYRQDPDSIAVQYDPLRVAEEYEVLFDEIQKQLGRKQAREISPAG